MADLEKFNIRPAVPDDCDEIMRLVVELAASVKMQDQVKINAKTLRKDCFNGHPKCYCVVAETVDKESKELIGYALYYPIYSTWDGISMHLEDIYVTPSLRGKGLGRDMLKAVTKISVDMGCNRLQLAVLGWNKIAKDWYERVGCINLTEKEDWNLMRLTKEEMEKFARS